MAFGSQQNPKNVLAFTAKFPASERCGGAQRQQIFATRDSIAE
jgi:hypothetical protein